MWTSSDGVNWSRVPYDEAVFGGAVMFSVTDGGTGLVAVGQTDPNDEVRWVDTDEGNLAPVTVRQADPNPAVWTSGDGITWSRVPHNENGP